MFLTVTLHRLLLTLFCCLPLAGHATPASLPSPDRTETPLSADPPPLTLTAEQRAWVKQHPVVPVLISNSHEPMTFLDEEGHETGFTLSLLKRIGEQSGITFSWQPFTNLEAMRAHLKQHPDALIALADASADNDSGVIYSNPYLVSQWVLVTRKNFPNVRTLNDMSGKSVAVYPGSYYLPELRQQFPRVNFEEENFTMETLFSLWTHGLDGAILPQGAASFFLKSYLADRFKIANVLPLPPLKQAMATSEQNSVLIAIINRALGDVSPQSMDAELSGWQLRFTLERMNVWGRYQNIFIATLALVIIIALMLVFFFWRNRLLKKNLALENALRGDLQRAKSRVDKISESKSVFLSQMSHEIRTPMNALIGLLELENQGRSSPEQRKNNIAVACDSARSLLMLLGDILDLAKIESGTFTVRSLPLSLSETLNSMATLFRFSADEKDLELITRSEVRDDNILFDPVMLKQIVSNLLSNAIKFTDVGQVEVLIYQTANTSSDRGDYVLEVCDSGIGLSEAQQKAIFEPYVQVDQHPSMRKGTGLGLSICRQLADLLGGTLEVESDAGEGTTFIFHFSAPLWQGKVEAPASLPQVSGAALTVLIVDDHPSNRLLLSQQLAFAGHSCRAAAEGEEALRLWLDASPPFDVVITDCNMPGMSGFELVRKIRALECDQGRQPRPVFGLTAMAEQAVMQQAKEAGMTDCLFKPVELATLLARINDTQPEANASAQIVMTLDKLAQSQPDTFIQFIESVVTQNRLDRQSLLEALARQNYPQLKAVAHRLQGGARLIDARPLSEICRQLEAAALGGEASAIARLAASGVAQIDVLEQALITILHQRKSAGQRDQT